jgi:predicted GIY-YIG superfamily endonuclease
MLTSQQINMCCPSEAWVRSTVEYHLQSRRGPKIKAETLCLYVLVNAGTGLYVGVTANVEQRLAQHRARPKTQVRAALGTGSCIKLLHVWSGLPTVQALKLECHLQKIQTKVGNKAIRYLCETCPTVAELLCLLGYERAAGRYGSQFGACVRGESGGAPAA